MDETRANMLRGAFGVPTTTAAAPAKPQSPPGPKQTAKDAYDSHYKKLIAKGQTPKQAAAFATQIVKRLKAAGEVT